MAEKKNLKSQESEAASARKRIFYDSPNSHLEIVEIIVETDAKTLGESFVCMTFVA